MENELKRIEDDLVPVYATSTGERVVYGSELHAVLGVKSRFNDWIKNRLKDCDALENEEFQSFTKKEVPDTESAGHADAAHPEPDAGIGATVTASHKYGAETKGNRPEGFGTGKQDRTAG